MWVAGGRGGGTGGGGAAGGGGSGGGGATTNRSVVELGDTNLFVRRKDGFTPSSKWSVDDSPLTTFRVKTDESVLQQQRSIFRAQSGCVPRLLVTQ